jgi:hypothetical protein
MMQGKRVYVVSALMLIISIILIRILAVQLTNYCLTPKVGQSYSAYQKVLVNDNDGALYEEMEYTQVQVYNYTNDSVFYILTMYNGVNCNDSLASTIVEFSKIYH